MDKLKVLKAGGVERFHTEPGISGQSVAEHSWGVAMILPMIYENCPNHLIVAALIHDLPEAYTGDLPAPVKRDSRDLEAALRDLERQWVRRVGLPVIPLEPHEKAALKLADYLEGMWTCLRKRKAGELDAVEIFYKFAEYMDDYFQLYVGEFPTAYKLRAELVSEMAFCNK